MLMSSEKEEDPDVIPEDSNLLTLRYAVTVLSWYPYLGVENHLRAGCLFPLQAMVYFLKHRAKQKHQPLVGSLVGVFCLNIA